MRIYLGLSLIVLAGGAAVLGLRQRLWWRVLRRAEVTTPEQLLESARNGRLERRVRAVVGLAGPGPEAVRSTVNGEPCVWHRHTVRHQQVRHRTDRQGRSRRSSRTRRVADVRSDSAFTVTDQAGRVDVLPTAMRVHRAERRANRILPGIASKPIPESAELFSGGMIQNTYHHREWIIRAGTPLYVLGEVSGRGSRVAIRRPARGLHLISTRGAAQLVRRARTAMVAGFAAAAALLALGIVLLVV